MQLVILLDEDGIELVVKANDIALQEHASLGRYLRTADFFHSLL